MNTLSKYITRHFFRDRDGYNRLQAHMNGLMHEDRRRAAVVRKARKHDNGIDPATVEKPRLTAAHHLLYLVLRGKDWRKAFAPITRPSTLANGATRWRAATIAIKQLHSEWHEALLLAPFAELLANRAVRTNDASRAVAEGHDVLVLIRRLVPLGVGYDWQANLDTAPAYADTPEQDRAEETP
jgi:hypothetical protein